MRLVLCKASSIACRSLYHPLPSLHDYIKRVISRHSNRIQSSSVSMDPPHDAVPSNLTELLAVAPLYHLAPTQDLAPLVSVSRIQPHCLEPGDYLSNEANQLFKVAEDTLNSDPGRASQLIAGIAQKFNTFQSDELDSLTFKRPVISGQTGALLSVEPLPGVFSGLCSDADLIEDGNLVDFDIDLDMSDMAENHLHILKGDDTEAQVLDHVNLYKRKCDVEVEMSMKKKARRVVSTRDHSRFFRNSAAMDCSGLNDARLDAFYVAVNHMCDGVDESVNTTNTSGWSHPSSGSHWTTFSGDVMVLTALGVSEIKRLLLSLTDSKLVSECDSEYLQKVQRLLVDTIRAAEDLVVRGDFTHLTKPLEAIMALFLILNSNHTDRKLHLDSHLSSVVGFLSTLIQSELIALSNTLILNLIIECLENLSAQVANMTIDEQILTQIEYMCFRGALETWSKNYSDVKNVLVMILVQIFKHYESQRAFVVNEMLLNFSKLPLEKGLIRECVLSSTVNVSFFTLFLVRLTQSYDALELRKDITNLYSSTKSRNPRSSFSLKREALLNDVNDIHEKALMTAQQVADFFLTKLEDADLQFKNTFSGMMEDIFAMMSMAEWPGAEILAISIVQSLIYAIRSQKAKPAIEPYFLEILGKFGLETLRLKLKSSSFAQLADSEDQKFVQAQKTNQQILRYLRKRSSKPFHSNSEFHFHLVRNLSDLHVQLTELSHFQTEHPGSEIDSTDKHNSGLTFEILRFVDEYLLTIANGSKLLEFGSEDLDVSRSNQIHRQLILDRSFGHLYDDFLQLLTESLDSKKVKVAARAIKVLSSLVELEASILLHQRIAKSISRLLMEGSTLSKDAVIELLANYMFSNKNLLGKYYLVIGDRADDEGISVRKRVLKIMKACYLQAEDQSIKIFSALKILKRLEDEESTIVESAYNNLYELLLDKVDAKITSEVIIEMVGNDRGAIDLFKGFIERATQTPNRKDALSAFKLIFNTTFDRIIDDVDSQSKIINSEKSFHLIAILAECISDLVTQDQLVSLLPFLVPSGSENGLVCLNALIIFKIAIPDLDVLRPEFVVKIESLLLKELTKFDNRELHEAVQIINMLSPISKKCVLHIATISTMKLLWSSVRENDFNLLRKEVSKTKKLISLLGCFGSYCDFESLRDAFMKSKLGLKENESVVSLIVRYLLYFCSSGVPDELRLAAIRNILSIAIFNPRLFLSQSLLSILDQELESSSVRIKFEIIRGLAKFLSREENESRKKHRIKSNSFLVEDVEQNSFIKTSISSFRDGVCSSVIQRYIGVALKLCLINSSIDAEIPVSFLNLVTKMGFANPKICIATIMALEASPNKRIKRIAIDMHTEIFEKHESLVDRNYVDAVKLAAEYTKKCAPNGHFKETSFLRSVYRVVGKSYSSKKKFVLSIAKLFMLKTATDSLEEAVVQRDVAVFLALNLQVLNFSSMEEILLTIYHLDRCISLDGLDLSERVSSIIVSQDGSGMSVSNLQLLFVFSQTMLAFVYLRQTLAETYSVHAPMMDGFRPSRPDLELRQQPKIATFVDYPVHKLGLNTKLSDPSLFGPIFTRIVSAAKYFTS